jgi:hypothetical protein
MIEGKMDRSKLSFGQAEGIDPLPAQLQLREVSGRLAARLWAVIHESMQESIINRGYNTPYISKPWDNILYNWHVYELDEMADAFTNEAEQQLYRVKSYITAPHYVTVFNFIEYVVRHKDCPLGLIKKLAWALESSQAAYRIIDQTVMPIGTEEQGKAVETAFNDVRGSYPAANTHLRMAGEYLTAGAFADSVRESIHAVESVARRLDPEASTLGPALVALEKRGQVHPALRVGFSKLYAYTSDQDGVRHALLEGPQADVDEADALYMFGACASFVSYLIRKAHLTA